MCELLAISSRTPIRIATALSALAQHAASDGDKDGWGVASYEGGDVRLVKDVQNADVSPWARFVESLDLQSAMVVAHIRKATVGDVALRNVHPFTREVDGRPHVFAHNGSAPGIFDSPDFRFDRFRPIGETDSEHAFCALLERVDAAGRKTGGILKIDERADIVAEFAQAFRQAGTANFIYADGDALFVHGDRRDGGAGLHVLADPVRGAAREGDNPSLLIASKQLGPGPWTPLAKGELLVARVGAFVAARRT